MVTKIVPKTHEHTFFFFSHKDWGHSCPWLIACLSFPNLSLQSDVTSPFFTLLFFSSSSRVFYSCTISFSSRVSFLAAKSNQKTIFLFLFHSKTHGV
jgi:hypothetical protein